MKREWSTAVAATSPIDPIRDARIDRHYGEILPFAPSRPGSWVCASTTVGRTQVTAIGLYGLLDEDSGASMHRSLSELSPVFDHSRYGRNLLLGGDFNIVANSKPSDPYRARYFAVLERIKPRPTIQSASHDVG